MNCRIGKSYRLVKKYLKPSDSYTNYVKYQYYVPHNERKAHGEYCKAYCTTLEGAERPVIVHPDGCSVSCEYCKHHDIICLHLKEKK